MFDNITPVQLMFTIAVLTVVIPGLLYLCIKAVMRAKNEEKLDYLKKLGGFNGKSKG